MLKKTNPDRNKISNLWLGFAFGILTATSLAFIFGTKKGRQTLKKILELSENLEENLEEITDEIKSMITDKENQTSETIQHKPILGSLLDKMKSLRN